MAQEILSVRMDKDLKKEFGEFCSKVGLSISSVINMYARKVVDEQKIPFEVSAKKKPDRLGYIKAMKKLKQEVVDKYPEKLSLEEFNKIYFRIVKDYFYRDEEIGFDPYSKEDLLDSIEGMITFEEIREESSKRFPNGVSMDEINEEIDKIRRGIK